MTEVTPLQISKQDSVPKPSLPSPTSSKMTEIGAWVAVLVVIAWLILLFVLLNKVEANDGEWTRIYTLWTSLETVAFAAAGALFGTTIQQRRVQDAKEESKQAKDDAKDARKNATASADAASKGRTLAEALKMTATREHGNGAGLAEGQTSSAADLERLRKLAVELFPA